jgi:hypothetical protein
MRSYFYILNRMIIYFSHQFSPKGRAGGFHLLRYLPAIASRHVRHRLRLRQCRAGSGEAGGLRARSSRSTTSPLNALHLEVSDSCKIQVPPKSNSIAWVSVRQSQRVPSCKTTSTLPFCPSHHFC